MDAIPVPYLQICSAGKAKISANADNNHITDFARISQNKEAIGILSCSLYADELKSFKPFESLFIDKILNLLAIYGIILSYLFKIMNNEKVTQIIFTF